MNTFVGAEYVIANSLIALKKKGIDYITFSKLREIGFEIQVFLMISIWLSIEFHSSSRLALTFREK